jgi:hypothetical protein
LDPAVLAQLRIGDAVKSGKEVSTFMGWYDQPNSVAFLVGPESNEAVRGLKKVDLTRVPNLSLQTTAFLPISQTTLQIMYDYDFVVHAHATQPSDVVVSYEGERMILRKKAN